MRELAKQINSHVEVINVDTSTSNVVVKGPNNPEINLVPTPPSPQLLGSLFYPLQLPIPRPLNTIN